jgi:ubiquinone biosynthesis protein
VTSKNVPFQVEIPVPVLDLCDANVLTMSFCEGVRVDEFAQLKEWGLSRDAVMEAVAKAFGHMMYVADIFNGDPHPGTSCLPTIICLP